MSAATEELRLNIGAGATKIAGFTPVDCKNGNRADKLTQGDGTVAEIYASHILEHFSFGQVQDVLREWMRVLKPGGRIRLAVPDFNEIAKRYIAGDKGPHAAYVMGGQTDSNDFHRSLFDRQTLGGLMQSVGLRNIRPWHSQNGDCASLPISLNLQGEKPGVEQAEFVMPSLACIMSMPRLTFSDNMFSSIRMVSKLRIPFTQVMGVYWEQCLTRGILEQCAADGPPDYILTVDYDSVFDPEDVIEMCRLLKQNPGVDALAPIQARRGEDYTLMTLCDAEGNVRPEAKLEEFDVDLVSVRSAHFGLTLIKTKKLLALPHPWLHSQPDTEGRWGDGRVDADVAFWLKWREHGNTLYIASHIAIGHLERVVLWPNQSLQPFHQYIATYNQHGRPKEARL